MPSATPQDVDDKFYTKISGFFQPNGGSQPVITLMNGPPNVTLTKLAGAGVYSITLPTTYTNALIQALYMTFGHIKNASTDAPIFAGMLAGFAAPVVQFVLTNSLGAGVDFGPQANERVAWELYLKYFTVLTF